LITARDENPAAGRKRGTESPKEDEGFLFTDKIRGNMERKVPTTQTEEIDLYLRTIYSLLRTTTGVQIRTLEEVHGGTSSSLHPDARGLAPDTSAFIYSLLRLPICMVHVNTVVLGQNSMVFAQHGFVEVESWEVRPARARRRRCFFDGRETLACYIASRSDIDDVIPTLTAFQIEWNKLHLLLQTTASEMLSSELLTDTQKFEALANQLKMSFEDLGRLHVIWGDQFVEYLQQIRNRKQELKVRLLNGSLSEYWRATRGWMENIAAVQPQLMDRPVFFISSNTHSVSNLLSGFAAQVREELIAYLERKDNTELLGEWQGIQDQAIPSSEGNFLYYVLKKYQSTPEGSHLIEAQRLHEEEHGITRIPSAHTFDIEAQVIDLSKLDPQMMDERLANGCCTFLKDSDALILNIDYPLGLAAYNLLAKVTEYASRILGVYIMGKAASLNGVLGDVMIPNVIHDEHSRNTYLFQNAFTANDVAPYLVYGTVLDNQKAVSVLGTFLQNARIMDVFYREGYTDFEMEAGPYLSAAYEMVRPKRHPVDEIVNLYGAPFDVGILHYVSDTPLSKGKNLGAGTLSYFGMDSTYATTLAILRRIIQREEAYLEKKQRKLAVSAL
jgi:hypothetical protein